MLSTNECIYKNFALIGNLKPLNILKLLIVFKIQYIYILISNASATFLTYIKNIILNNLRCSIRMDVQTDRRAAASSRLSQFCEHA